ncbi:MFS transporter [Eubacterium oxidoreducens]|uniref:Major Facilitator Superfamily protein n=1 Tax=Eubacterium oxidoreducens TaxID=1732 RepID=A0A1G6B5E1_EUBOX|nr:MFS transporter [Eubacterium oxidoreducens]SDB15779.1 Major Facilitator Superfamily protein [Eubacterium oxidoreducens]
MASNANRGKFLANAILLCILGVIFMFLYSGLQNDQINIIWSFITEANGGWSQNATILPMTVGNFVCIPLTFLYGTLFVKFGVKKPLMVVLIITAIGVFGIVGANGLDCNGGAASGNYALFFVSLFVVRCGCMILQMAGFMLVANWFIKFRGQIMGIVTIGSPLFSVVGTGLMSSVIQDKFDGDYRYFYVGIAVVIIVIIVVVALFVRDTPEDVGCYPDGFDHAPVSEKIDEVKLTVRQVLSQKKGWQLIIAFGAFQFIINACMGSMAARYIALGGGDPTVAWVGVATKWLAVGAVLGIPMSYVFGFLDDKFGSIKASIVLGLCEFIPVLCLMLQPQGGSVPLMIGWGIGVACMTGGVPTLHPCITSYAYGRREYQSANRIIMAIQLIPSAFAAQMMVILINQGKATMGYGILIVVIIIGLVATISMLKLKDANAADRMYASAQENLADNVN